MIKVTYLFKGKNKLVKHVDYIAGAIKYHRYLMLNDPQYVACFIN